MYESQKDRSEKCCPTLPVFLKQITGSLLGITLHEGVSFPVGKVDEMTLYPMSFAEYVLAKHGRQAYERLRYSPIEELGSLKHWMTNIPLYAAARVKG